MNYIEQIKGFWIAQEINQLGTSEIAMYFHLLEIWNRTGWAGSFKRNNSKVKADLSIKSYNFSMVRDRLEAAGVLSYKQKNGDGNVEYRMTDLGNFYKGSGKGSVEGSGKGLGKGSGKGSVEDNINETKPNETVSKSHSGAGAPGEEDSNFQSPITIPEEKEEKKGSAQKKEEKTPHWAALVAVWFSFYEERFSASPSFGKTPGAALRSILLRLEKSAKGKNNAWTEDRAKRYLLHFLTKAYSDEWLKANFLLTNLSSKYDAIANHNPVNKPPKHGTNPNKPAPSKVGREIDFDKA